MSMGDLDGDGDPDIALLDAGQGVVILRNDGGNTAHWLEEEMVGNRSNRDGLGARVWISDDRGHHLREIHGGVGYQSSSAYRAHFGLGQNESISSVRVRWPNGSENLIVDPPVNQLLRVVELD